MSVQGLTWGETPAADWWADVDVIVAADCLFDKQVFEPFVATVESVLRHEMRQQSSSSAMREPLCLIAHHERNSSATLQELLDLYDLSMEPLDIVEMLGGADVYELLLDANPDASQVHCFCIKKRASSRPGNQLL